MPTTEKDWKFLSTLAVFVLFFVTRFKPVGKHCNLKHMGRFVYTDVSVYQRLILKQRRHGTDIFSN